MILTFEQFCIITLFRYNLFNSFKCRRRHTYTHNRTVKYLYRYSKKFKKLKKKDMDFQSVKKITATEIYFFIAGCKIIPNDYSQVKCTIYKNTNYKVRFYLFFKNTH